MADGAVVVVTASPDPGERSQVVRDIAAALLAPAELVAAHAGDHTSGVERVHGGILTTTHGSYRVRGDVVELDGWRGHTETVPRAELLDIAAASGTPAAAARMAAALADHDRAHNDASRYIRKHGDGGHCLTLAQQRAPEWLALCDRMGAVKTARAAWWDSSIDVVGVPGEQLDLFDDLIKEACGGR